MQEEMRGALHGDRYRVIVSTDIGGTDPDDYQSMVHYLLYADMFDTEGLISSPFDLGSAADLLQVIDAYERDYPVLHTWSEHYPTPAQLRAMTKQGALKGAPYKGWSVPTEGSEWIIRCARKPDDRPLYILIWGSLDDLAQALHDAPDIAPKLRVNCVAGPNKKWGPNSYAYIRENFPDLWMIEDNSSYCGFFIGGDMEGDMSNAGFVAAHAAGHGALGDYFASKLKGVLKMGDTPTVTWLLHGNPEAPEKDGWGGHFVPVNDMPCMELRHPITADTPGEVYGMTELIFTGPVIEPTEKPVFQFETRGQRFDGFCTAPGEYRIRCVTRETGDFPYVIHSSIPELNGLCGHIFMQEEDPGKRNTLSGNLTRWWSDDLSLVYSEKEVRGTKTVNRWRREVLTDFAERFDRCLGPKR